MKLLQRCARGLASFGLAGAAVAAPAGPWTDVDALVTYETRQVMASGITRTDTWQERLVRRGDQVWTERVLPGGSGVPHPGESASEHFGHKHLNADNAAHWLSLGANGQVELKLVDREHKLVVDIPAAEFATVSFDGRYDAAAAVVPPAVARAMKADAAATAEGQWRSERNQGWTHRVLWSETRQLALRVQSQRDDGSVQRSVTVRLLPASAGRSAPWQALAGYTPTHYDEFMD